MPSLPPSLVEFYRVTLPPEVWAAFPRPWARIDVSANTIILDDPHGAIQDEPLMLAGGPQQGGEGALPQGLSATATYYAIIVGTKVLQLAASPGGAAVDFGPAEGDYGARVLFSYDYALTQALQWATDRFLACAATNGWAEPIGGWQGDVKQRICDLVAWPQLSRRKADARTLDDYYKRWVQAGKDLCAITPLGVLPAPEPLPPGPPAIGAGSSGWGEPWRGFNGQPTPWSKAVIS